MKMKQVIYRHYLRLRPPSIGTFPDPGTIVNVEGFDRPKIIDGIGNAWGYVDYSLPLTAEQIADYELSEAVEL